MKSLVAALAVLSFVSTSYSQPVIQNGAQIPGPGLNVPVSIASSGSVGAAGQDQVWDFSGVTFTQIGALSVLEPMSSPMWSSFQQATYVYSLANTYSYFNVTADRMEVAAYSITSPGVGADMSPNPRTTLSFPFTYGSSVTDTWQKIGSNPNDVTITYDAYGTLITPTKTYHNVVRVKESYDNGDDYQWYILEPLMSIMVYDHNTQRFYHTAATSTADVRSAPKTNSVAAYPNPATHDITLKLGEEVRSATITISNALGQEISRMGAGAGKVVIPVEGLTAGTYFYSVTTEGEAISRGSFIVR